MRMILMSTCLQPIDVVAFTMLKRRNIYEAKNKFTFQIVCVLLDRAFQTMSFLSTRNHEHSSGRKMLCPDCSSADCTLQSSFSWWIFKFTRLLKFPVNSFATVSQENICLRGSQLIKNVSAEINSWNVNCELRFHPLKFMFYHNEILFFRKQFWGLPWQLRF